MTLALGDYMNLAFSTCTKGNKSYFLEASLPHRHTLSHKFIGWLLVRNLSFLPNQVFTHLYSIARPEMYQVLKSFKVETQAMSPF